jgi:hypothetical protein
MNRKIRKKLIKVLEQGDRDGFDQILHETEPVKLVSPLVSNFYSTDPMLKWESVLAFGKVANRLAEQEPESARIVMRRLMWSLNDESGGIGWGAPEAMAEAIARNRLLAEEYCRILVSYIREDGNYLEYLPLRRGALWGVMRFARFRPNLFNEIDAIRWLLPYIHDKDAESRALATLGAGYSANTALRPKIEPLIDDKTPVTLFLDNTLQQLSVSKAASIAMSMI